MFKTYLGRDSALAGEEVRRLLNQVEELPPDSMMKVESIRELIHPIKFIGHDEVVRTSIRMTPREFDAVHRLPKISDDQDLASPPGRTLPSRHTPLVT
jgi:hypothetical protein